MFRARLASRVLKIFGTDKLIMVRPIESFSDYNADASQLRIEPFKDVSYKLPSGSLHIQASFHINKLGSGVGTNAFGVS
ncbi:hypothetical protein, partial [Massilia sp. CT11-108]|uniref:hypothetical protein n=1 Tax=Massilia sp. CT11-108 TaxID=3393900 RepID=UPI0039A67233